MRLAGFDTEGDDAGQFVESAVGGGKRYVEGPDTPAQRRSAELSAQLRGDAHSRRN